jgi:sulfate permease, SulP family
MTIVTLLVLTGLFEKLPEPTLAAIVIAAVIELVDVGALIRLYQVYTRRLGEAYGVAARPDFIAAIAALLGVTVFDTLPGLFIGIAVSLLLLLYRSSRPRVTELVEIPGGDGRYGDAGRIEGGGRVPGVTILRVESGLYFANSDWVRDRVTAAAAHHDTKAVILDASDIPFVDVSACRCSTNWPTRWTARGSRSVSRGTPTSSVTSSGSPTPNTSSTASIPASQRRSWRQPAGQRLPALRRDRDLTSTVR